MSIGEQIRNQVMVRLADVRRDPVVAWCRANSARNDFDERVLDYPATKILTAYQDYPGGKTIAFMPVQGAAVLESIGPNPEATPLEVANGVMECVKGAALMADANGMKELYFLASDDVTAKGAEMMGFEALPYVVYRKKIL